MSETLRQRKADRFERVAKKELKSPWVMNEARLAMLLRREHRAVMRMVNNCVPNKAWSAVASLGYGQAVMDILNLLEARAQ